MLKETRAYFDSKIRHILEQIPCQSDTLKQAITYSVCIGGKRLRPMLTYAACASVQGNKEQADIVACAVELIHTFSLIHDDLPAMDNDDFRRGQPSNHKVFGEDIAILAGDALHTMAFELLALPENRLTDFQVRKMSYILAKACGASGMVAGQVLDCQATQKKLSLPEIRRIHQLKTGQLIAASVELGAWCHQEKKASAHLPTLLQFADTLGIIFQVQDDLLDLTGSFASLGKTPRKDFAQGKSTYPSCLGIAETEALLSKLTQDAQQLLPTIPNNSLMTALFQEMVNRTS